MWPPAISSLVRHVWRIVISGLILLSSCSCSFHLDNCQYWGMVLVRLCGKVEDHFQIGTCLCYHQDWHSFLNHTIHQLVPMQRRNVHHWTATLYHVDLYKAHVRLYYNNWSMKHFKYPGMWGEGRERKDKVLRGISISGNDNRCFGFSWREVAS